MADDRLTYAIPVDVARAFDTTTTQAQIDADTFPPAADSQDLLASFIEDVESEFDTATDDQMKIGRVGQAGSRETYEQPTYKLSGHKLTKGTFTGVWSEYLPQERVMPLDNERILPFDAAAGDEVYIYRGLGDDTGLGGSDGWEDVTDQQGEMWDILDHVDGQFVFSPIETAEFLIDLHTGSLAGTVPSFLRRIRFAVSYRYGGLGGSRSRPTRTTLDGALSAGDTGSVSVGDGTAFPTAGSSGAVVVLIGREYILVDPDPDTDSMEIVERGVRGTTADDHDDGDRVQYTPPAVRKAVTARAAEQLVSSGRYQDWLPDTEDDLSKGDMADQFSDTWERTIEALS